MIKGYNNVFGNFQSIQKYLLMQSNTYNKNYLAKHKNTC